MRVPKTKTLNQDLARKYHFARFRAICASLYVECRRMEEENSPCNASRYGHVCDRSCGSRRYNAR